LNADSPKVPLVLKFGEKIVQVASSAWQASLALANRTEPPSKDQERLLEILLVLASVNDPPRKIDGSLESFPESMKGKIVIAQPAAPEAASSEAKPSPSPPPVNVAVGREGLAARILAISKGVKTSEEKPAATKKEVGISLTALRQHIFTTFIDTSQGSAFILELW